MCCATCRMPHVSFSIHHAAYTTRDHCKDGYGRCSMRQQACVEHNEYSKCKPGVLSLMEPCIHQHTAEDESEHFCKKTLIIIMCHSDAEKCLCSAVCMTSFVVFEVWTRMRHVRRFRCHHIQILWCRTKVYTACALIFNTFHAGIAMLAESLMQLLTRPDYCHSRKEQPEPHMQRPLCILESSK